MKAHIELKSLLAGALLGAVVTFTIAAGGNPPNNPPNRPEWEYKVITANALSGELEQSINRSVRNGWEFLSVSHQNDQWSLAVLKRERDLAGRPR
jgi:hypothetical protein